MITINRAENGFILTLPEPDGAFEKRNFKEMVSGITKDPLLQQPDPEPLEDNTFYKQKNVYIFKTLAELLKFIYERFPEL